jgi:hypothetical protein
MSKRFFLNERCDQIALLRRNDGDVVSQHAQDVGKVFVGWRAAMHLLAKIHVMRASASSMSQM